MRNFKSFFRIRALKMTAVAGIACASVSVGCNGEPPVAGAVTNNGSAVDSIPIVPKGQVNIHYSYYLSYFGFTKPTDPQQRWVCLKMDSSATREFCDDPAYSDPPEKIYAIEENHIQVEYVTVGMPSDGVVLRMKSNLDKFLYAYVQGEIRLRTTHFLEVPTDLRSEYMAPYRFKLHDRGIGNYGEKKYAIESVKYPGYYIDDIGPLDHAKGVILSASPSPAGAFAWSFFQK